MESLTNESHTSKDVSTEPPTVDNSTLQDPAEDDIAEIFRVLMTIDYPEDAGTADHISHILAIFSQVQTDLLPYHMLRESHRLEILQGLEEISRYLDSWKGNLQALIDEREKARQYLPFLPTSIDSTEYIPGTQLRTAIARWREKMPPHSKQWAKEGKLMNLVQQFYFKSVYQPYMETFEKDLDAKAKSLEPELSKVTYKLQILCGFFSRLNSLVEHMMGQYLAAKNLLKTCSKDLREPYNKYKADLREADVVIARLKEQNQTMQERLQLRASDPVDSARGLEELNLMSSDEESVLTTRKVPDGTPIERPPSQASTPRRFNHFGLKLKIPTTPAPEEFQTVTSASTRVDPNLVTSPTDDGVEIDHMAEGVGNLTLMRDTVSTLEPTWMSESTMLAEEPEQDALQSEEPEADAKGSVPEGPGPGLEPSTPPQMKVGDAGNAWATYHSPHTPLGSMRGGETRRHAKNADSEPTPPDASGDLSYSSDHALSVRSFRQMIRDLTSSGDSSRRRGHSRRENLSRKPTM